MDFATTVTTKWKLASTCHSDQSSTHFKQICRLQLLFTSEPFNFTTVSLFLLGTFLGDQMHIYVHTGSHRMYFPDRDQEITQCRLTAHDLIMQMRFIFFTIQLLPVYQSRGGVSADKLHSYASAMFSAAKVSDFDISGHYILEIVKHLIIFFSILYIRHFQKDFQWLVSHTPSCITSYILYNDSR